QLRFLPSRARAPAGARLVFLTPVSCPVSPGSARAGCATRATRPRASTPVKDLANGAGAGYVRRVKERPHPAKEQDMNRMGTARRLAVAVLGLGVFAAVSAAQPPRRPALDPLAEARARQSIA